MATPLRNLRMRFIHYQSSNCVTSIVFALGKCVTDILPQLFTCDEDVAKKQITLLGFYQSNQLHIKREHVDSQIFQSSSSQLYL